MPKTDMSVNFGKWMRHRRTELRLTQPQVAKRISQELPAMAADKQRISDWERGYNMPSDTYKPAIVAALEVDDVSYFYRPFDDTPTPDVLTALSKPEESEDINSRLAGLDEQVRLLRAQLATRDAEVLSQIGQVHRAIQDLRGQRPR